MVTPMDLQVLFMQEGRAARHADRVEKSPAEARAATARKIAQESQEDSVNSANEAAAARDIDEEGGGQGGAGYFARRRSQAPEIEEEEEKKPPPDLEGKGDVMDLKI
ncbi:MAG: hypothetical protein ACLFN5_03505 [bacterium]